MHNDLIERDYEATLSTLFEGTVQSLIYHQHDTATELFDLVAEADIVAFATSKGQVNRKAYYLLQIAFSLKKVVFRVWENEVIREDDFKNKPPRQ